MPDLGEDAAIAFVTEDAQRLIEQSFDLSRSGSIRAWMYLRNSSDIFVASSLPHSVADAYSVYTQVGKLPDIYAALSAGTPFDATTEMERQAPEPDETSVARSLGALRRFTSDAPETAMEIPADSVDPSWRKKISVVQSAVEMETMARFCKRDGVRATTLHMALYALMRARVTGQRSVVLTLPGHGRTRATKKLLE